MAIGLKRVPKPLSLLKEASEEVNQTDDEDEKDTNVTELPEKVDEFMSYINRVYFDGQLDEKGKEIFKSDMNKLEKSSLSTSKNENFDNHTPPRNLRRKILITT